MRLEVAVRNPFARPEAATVRLVVPEGWTATPEVEEVDLPEAGETLLWFDVTVGGEPVLRARVAADVTIGGTRFGQQAEALVTVE